MPVQRDILAVLSPDERRDLMRHTVMGVLGPVMGERVWKQMEPALLDRRRQPGDAADPAENHWKGVWRIYEAE